MKKISKHRGIDIHAPGFPLVPKLIATSLGAGFLPYAPGTWGALVGIALWLPLWFWATPEVTALVSCCAIVVVAIAGTWASSVAERYWGKDPVVACVDETVGQWIALLPVNGLFPWWEIVLSLVLFRFFDMVKPLGIRSMERLPRGYGMMADDVLAGLYSAAILIILNICMR